MLTTRVKIWLKTYGRQKQDSWWIMPAHSVTNRFIRSLEWEMDKESWIVLPNKSIMILLDWDGDITSLDPERVMSEMDILGQCMGHDGWAPLKRLSEQEDIFIMFKIPNYHEMIAS